MTELERFRKQKDKFLKSDPHSPLSKEQQRAFTGLTYYPENPALRFDAKVEPFAPGRRTLDSSKPRTKNSPVLKSGDPAPGFTLQTVDGQAVSLGDALRQGHNVLLVFLRHLG